MIIEHVERLLKQLIRLDEAKNGNITFNIGENDIISHDQFISKDGFMPLLVAMSSTLEKMLNKNTTKHVFIIEENLNTPLEQSVQINRNMRADTQINVVALSLSASLDILLNQESNPYIQKDIATGQRTLDLRQVLADFSRIRSDMSSVSLAIPHDVIERLFHINEDDASLQQSMGQ